MAHKRVTMQQVAERAGVSRTTVSFVLNNTPNVNISAETRARIWRAAADLNYARDFAAHSLATGRSHTIAFVLRQTPQELLVNAFLGGLLGGVRQAVHDYDYRVLFEIVEGGETDVYMNLVRSQRVDGLLISGPFLSDQEITPLVTQGVPLVIHGSLDDRSIYSVDIDNVSSARIATQHLIDLGHTRIAHITNGPLEYTAARDRLAGFRLALQDGSLPLPEDYVQVSRSFTDQGGYAAMQALLQLPQRPTAVFAASDVVAFGALQAIRDAGLRVPEDLSVVGFDDIPLARYLDPPLTTVRLPALELGLEAGRMLMQIIQNTPPAKTHVQLDTEFIVRGSSAPPRLS